MKHRYLSLLTILCIALSCSHQKYEKTVSKVDRDRFMGDWYVQAGRFTFLESDPYNSIESYSWNEKEGRIDVDFRYNKGKLDGPLKKYPQKAWIENKTTNAHWKVQPIWPIKADYLIIALDPDYQWTAIGVPDQKYLWVMSRDPQFSKEKVGEVMKELDRLGYSTKDIQYVEHSKK